MRLFHSLYLLLIIFLVVPITTLANHPTYPEMMIVLDGSGSMWGKVGSETKIEIARKVLQQVVPSLPQEVKFGLAAYGHNRKGDCSDIEIVIPPGSDDKEQLLKKALALQPKGKTPIADTLQQVTELLRTKENETTIVLVSDGEETCNDDPCGAVKQMKESGIKFVLHVVGFDVNDSQQQQLRCLAEAGGGNYYSAEGASALLASFEQVQKGVEEKVEKAKATTKKAKSKLGKLKITIPEEGLVSLNALKLNRIKDNKLIKTIKPPVAESLHPLLAGEYELVAGFANANYAKDSEVTFGTWEVIGGEVTEVELGVLNINIADSLKKMAVGGVIITRTDMPDFKLITPYNDNDYYLYKPKPLPAGTYTIGVHYKRTYLYKTPDSSIVLADGVEVPSGGSGTATLDSGIQLLKPQTSGVMGYELISTEATWGPMKISAASNGDYPLWQIYCVPAGTYSLNVLMEGMDEPLPVADDITIASGQLLEFDTGL